MNLVDPKDLLKANEGLNKLGGIGLAKLLMHVLRLNKINKLFSKINDKHGIEFVEALIGELKIKFEYNEEELNHIPEKGAFITASNHPFGGIDGILLIRLLYSKRPDYKVMANFLLKKIPQLSDFFFGVNPFEDNKSVFSSTRGIKQSLIHLKKGSPIGIFPAGEVSSFQSGFNITDKQWASSSLKLIRKAEVPVVPIFFEGKNSTLFHLLGMIHPSLRTVKLPSELLNKKRKTLKVRIGSPISVKEQNELKDIDRFGRYLRSRTYALGTPFKVKEFFQFEYVTPHVEEIVPPVDVTELKKEIASLKKNHLLFKNNNYEIYCAPTFLLPSIHKELGRLRELTFRDVGEGTNRSIDIDEYDLYYLQLFIWDSKAHKIVGAYRVGKGKDIFEQYGIKGFYIQSLFKIKKPLYSILSESLELGRSFIVKEYQKKLLPLFLLWKGILYFLLKNPEYRYLVGPVSISNKYSDFSKDLVIKFIMANHFNYQLAGYVQPRNKFMVKTKQFDIDIILEAAKDDINKIDKYIGDIEPSGDKLPVLLKKYIAQNAQLICFNVDPKFNDSLDGLIILDLFDVPMKTIESLSQEIDDETILERLSGKKEKTL